MDDNTRIATIKGFLSKQRYLRQFKNTVAIVDDTPIIMFDSINDQARARLSTSLEQADLLHIQIMVKPRKPAR